MDEPDITSPFNPVAAETPVVGETTVEDPTADDGSPMVGAPTKGNGNANADADDNDEDEDRSDHPHPPIDPDLIRPFAHFGGCWNGIVSQDIRCTDDPAVCSDPPFVSGLRIDDLTSSPDDRCHASDLLAKRCIGPGTLGMCSGGGCGSMSSPSSSSSSQSPFDGAAEDADCNLVKDVETDVATLYGACQEVYSGTIRGCYWDRTDCEHWETSQERWLTSEELVRFSSDLDNPSRHPKGYCDCSDVRVGACRTAQGLLCAVDADQCGPGEAFASARTIEENPSVYGTLDCRLCPSNDITDGVRTATIAFLSAELGNDLNVDADVRVDGPFSSLTSSMSSSSDGVAGHSSAESWRSDEAGVVAGAIIGGIVGTLVTLCLVLCAYRCWNVRVERSKPGVSSWSSSSSSMDVEHQPTFMEEDGDDVPVVRQGEVS